ncbi:MAG: efflux RND transporter periplasmic adaptor subunit, partial [Limisphaerales bacterium]
STVVNDISIPESAIVEEEGRPIAFVQLSGETFEKRDLTLGIRGGGRVQVLEGIEEGERVVSRGAYAIRLASVSNVIPAHGHAH